MKKLAALVMSLLLLTPGIAVAADPQSELVMVLDSSGSMQEVDDSGLARIDAAKSALVRAVDGLPPDARVGLRVYGATVAERSDPAACKDSQLVVPVGPAAKPTLKAAIAKYRPYGETPIAYSLQQAAGDLGAHGKRTILLVSDGEETCAADPCAVARSIHDRGIDLTIDVVGLKVDGKARQQLRCIADAGGGTYYDAQRIEDLTKTLEQTALRAFRPFVLTGQPIGAGPLSAGQYTDSLGGTTEASGVRTFEVRKAAGSTIHVGFTAYPKSHGGAIGYNDAVTLVLRSPAGDECARKTGLQLRAGTRNLLVADLSLPVDQAACAEADQLALEVRRGTGGQPDPAPETGAIPFELVLIEEPAVTSTEDLPDPIPAGAKPTSKGPADTASALGAIAGGGGFSQAATLRPGTWQDTIQPGEVLFYRARVDWGQAVAAGIHLQPDAQAAKALGAYGVNVNLEVFGPTRATLLHGDLHTVAPGVPTTVGSSIPPVRYRNRESTDAVQRSISLAGYYYFVVTMQESTARAQVPLRITLAVTGAPAGAPAYAGAAPSESPSASPVSSEPTAAGTSVRPTAADTDRAALTTTQMILGIGGLLAALALLALVIHLARRPTPR